MITADLLDTLEPQQMRAALLSLMGELAERDGVIERQGQEVVFKQERAAQAHEVRRAVGALQRRAEEPAR